ncbi:MAG: ABC transporter permease subunit [Eubacteriales bacterium]|nr:ABC transporter permease subunit [Eubacteriales bacterium]
MTSLTTAKPATRAGTLWKSMVKHRYIYFMLIPVVAYYLIFHYATMYYSVIAFMDYKPMKGIEGSKFVGFKHFTDFLTGVYAWRVIRNTLLLNLYQILFSFTGSIIFALMINQMMENKYKNLIQTVTYMPHFISVVVVCGLLTEFCESTSIFGDILALFGVERSNLLASPNNFRTIFVASDMWQHMGWGTIIYLATLSGVDPSLHEAATIDGAGRIQRIIHVNIPAILPVIVIQLIMRVGNMMVMGYEKIILLYSPAIYETSDVISSYVYRRGLMERDYSYGAAVGLFNSIINLTILIGANAFSRRVTETSLW